MLCPRLYKELPLLLHTSERADLSVVGGREIIRHDHRAIDPDHAPSAYYYRVMCRIQVEIQSGKSLIRLVCFAICKGDFANVGLYGVLFFVPGKLPALDKGGP